METFGVTKVSVAVSRLFYRRMADFVGGRTLILRLKRLSMTSRQIPRTMFRLFLQGLLILAPISITIWILYSAFNLIDGILRPNPDCVDPTAFQRKVTSYRSRWPWLRVRESA